MRQQVRFLSSVRRPSTERLRLLTYPMALAQPHATVPLLQTPTDMTHDERHPSSSCHVKLRGLAKEYPCPQGGGIVNPRRWVRGPEELCVASLRRSKNMNKINTYVATYKFDDPQWSPILLPSVVLRPPRPAEADAHETAEGKEKTGKDPAGAVAAPAAVSSPPSDPTPPFADEASSDYRGRVVIDHNKLVTLECMARHVNFSLRHIVQKGHGVYLLHHAQHSVLHPKGIVEQSFVTCSFGIRGERLRTDIVHVGPLDAMDVLDVQTGPGGHTRCVFDFQKPNVARGVVAVSQVEGYGTWFQRKPMLWQRSRRIGALQSQLGAFAYDLAAPHAVGKRHECDVFLLAPHMHFFANGAGGAEAVGIVASSQVAQQERLYLGEFEAPAMTALDAVHQLAHASALRCRLVTPVSSDKKSCEDEAAEMETLLPVSWATRTPPPYVPLEADLPFKLQMSRPAVIGGEAHQHQQQMAYPTGGTVGSPFVGGAPLVLFEYNLHQGVDHYVFDDAPSARPMKWWSQKSNLPYSGYMYFVRSGRVDSLTPTEEIPNPLEPVAKRRPLHNIVPPTKTVLRRMNRYKRTLQEGGKKTIHPKKRAETAAAAAEAAEAGTTAQHARDADARTSGDSDN
ncbi:hypothetical protein DQ04_04811010 [Trypanosoma grayi]|uniref:hypothetical protein n=1 Tax=Trypanosoma grayi TaxID=71804 RepID=UPI0004F4A7C6|nr:hypothetical protein DQ04_04811010 [Trypanosoma grayi]KEG09686.1 hypothetical protein DQ04_04811010 [Trypanosoma grayi]